MKCKSNYLKSPLASLSSSAISLSYWPYCGLLSSQGRTHICLGLLRLLSARILSSSARRVSITASSLLLIPISRALNSASRPTRVRLWGGISASFSAMYSQMRDTVYRNKYRSDRRPIPRFFYKPRQNP